jgi:hypothetical protein
MISFHEIIEKIYGLPLEEKIELKNLLEHHISDERRNEILSNYKASIEEQKSGKLKFSSSIKDLKNTL